jgi:hypothetical protein
MDTAPGSTNIPEPGTPGSLAPAPVPGGTNMPDSSNPGTVSPTAPATGK